MRSTKKVIETVISNKLLEVRKKAREGHEVENNARNVSDIPPQRL
jgi:hypothetical protein